MALFSDADLSTPIEELHKVVDPILVGQYDVVFGSRALDRSLIGVHQPWLREYGVRRALFGSALLFALIHASLVALVPILVLGLGLALVYHRTRSLLAAIMMHATVNGVSVPRFYRGRFVGTTHRFDHRTIMAALLPPKAPPVASPSAKLDE